jgi:hypothetical protein
MLQAKRVATWIKSDEELVEAHLHHTRFNGAFAHFNRTRRLAIIRDGYIGMVPQGTQIGDDVCILYGMGTPFVIREEPVQKYLLKSYQLVSDCYIHGMMDGEALEAQVPEQPIIFC